MRYLRQNTATRVTVGPFYDKTDAITPEVALTATNEKLTFVVDDAGVPTLVIDANATASGGSNDLVHITGDDAGYYDLELTAAQTNYVGRAMLSITYATDHVPVSHEFMIMPTNVYDSMFGTDLLDVSVTQFGGTNGTFAAGRPEVNLTHVAGSSVNTSAAQLGVNVVNFGGAAGTFAAGRPEVNTSHFGGTAGTFAAGRAEVNVSHWKGTAAATVDTAGYPVVTVKNGSGAGEITTTSGTVSISSSTINTIADQVWDEAASAHVAAGSFGARNNIVRSATAQAGSSTSITLDASASATNDFYNNCRVDIVAGTGAGQGAFISDYVGTTKVASLNDTLQVAPSSDSVFVITAFGSLPGASAPSAATIADAVWDEARSGHTSAGSFGETAQVVRSGTAQAGASSSITLDASASATNDLYKYQIVRLVSGTGAGQSRQITAYNGTTKVATVGLAWTTNPDATSVFVVQDLGIDAATVGQIADAVWDEARSGHVGAGSFGEYVLADAVRISSSAASADSLESILTGGGGTITANLTGTVATVTTLTGHTPQTGDTYARLGAPVGASISADLQTVDANVDAILADTADMQPKLGAPAGASMSADIAAIQSDTNDIQTRIPASLTSGSINANITRINGAAVTGDGSTTPWDAA